MKMTLEQLETIINEMKKENVTSVDLDFGYKDGSVDEFYVDILKNHNFFKTILTISR